MPLQHQQMSSLNPPISTVLLPSKQKNICITLIQCWTNVEGVELTFYKCYANVLCLQMFCVCWISLNEDTLALAFCRCRGVYCFWFCNALIRVLLSSMKWTVYSRGNMYPQLQVLLLLMLCMAVF